MKNAEIRELTDQELTERLDAESINYQVMILNHAVSPLENPSQITKLRRIIARMKTELRRRELNK
ncbi:MAG TPA: 50S ribosomal protein L29 [Bacteroidaceae bacterium]|nr:50S ribosomal protein L29 [Bacteroidaceae bacterium]